MPCQIIIFIDKCTVDINLCYKYSMCASVCGSCCLSLVLAAVLLCIHV